MRPLSAAASMGSVEAVFLDSADSINQAANMSTPTAIKTWIDGLMAKAQEASS